MALTDLKHEGVHLFSDVLVCQLVLRGRFQQEVQERQPPLHADGVKGLISLCGFSQLASELSSALLDHL